MLTRCLSLALCIIQESRTITEALNGLGSSRASMGCIGDPALAGCMVLPMTEPGFRPRHGIRQARLAGVQIAPHLATRHHAEIGALAASAANPCSAIIRLCRRKNPQ